VVGAFLRVFFASRRAGAIHLPATRFANSHVQVTNRAGAVYHAVAFGAAHIAFRNYPGVNLVYIYSYAVVEHVAFAFKILAAGLHAILDNAAVQLVHVLKALLQQKRTCLLTLDAAGAVSQDFLVFILLLQ